MQVNTVLGPVDVDSLGVTLPHEHLYIDLYRVFQPHRDMRLDDPDVICEELALFKNAGGGAVFDVTTPDLGRDVAVLADISRRTGVHVLMGTGRYREPFYEREIWERSTNDLARMFVEEVEHGVDGVRPAFLGEIGAHGYHVSPVEERLHRAIARAHKATGLPITTHAVESPVGLVQLDIFEEEGVDLRRVVIGHCDSYPKLDYHEAILARGAFVEFDLIRGVYPAETRRQLRLVCELVNRGYCDRLLLSQDVCMEHHLVGYGGNGYAYVVTDFSDLLVEAGMSREQVETMLIENPRRVLAGS